MPDGAPSRAPAVRLDGVSKRFGSTQAVKSVSLSFDAGEVHAVLGENGAGKSTLGKIVGGLIEPDEGRLLLGGTPRRLRGVAEARRAGICMVFQELSLVPDLTVRENIALGTEVAAHPFALLRHRAERADYHALLRAHGLDIDLDRRVGRLPVALQQLIEVVKALARRPSVLILDEPTAMLGVHEKRTLLDIIGQARGHGVAVVFVTHHVDEVVAVADRVSLMKDGALVESFAVTARTNAEAIAAKLTGGARSATPRRRAAAGREMLAIRNLPGLPPHRSIDIVVGAGEVVGLYGVVGSGCERIGHAAVGLADIDPAAMLLLGRAWRPRDPTAAAHGGVSYLPSGRAANGILPNRSTRENLKVSQLDRVARRGYISDRAERRLTQSLLARFATRYASYDDAITSLSGGNQQKVMIARCLGRSGKVVVLEDPTAGVDIGAKQDIHQAIREQAAAGLAILLISSDLRETIALSDVIFTAIGGRIVRRYAEPTHADEASIIADVIGG